MSKLQSLILGVIPSLKLWLFHTVLLMRKGTISHAKNRQLRMLHLFLGYTVLEQSWPPSQLMPILLYYLPFVSHHFLLSQIILTISVWVFSSFLLSSGLLSKIFSATHLIPSG
jgi:hypothetical protein